MLPDNYGKARLKWQRRLEGSVLRALAISSLNTRSFCKLSCVDDIMEEGGLVSECREKAISDLLSFVEASGNVCAIVCCCDSPR